MLIKEIEAVPVKVPLDAPYVYARGSMTAFETVIVRLLTDDGIVGYGESAPLFRSPTGDARSVARIINGPVAQILLGCAGMRSLRC
jgi:L-alanine-DL-glutamate epimerase-like enolase superfamily enzyme